MSINRELTAKVLFTMMLVVMGAGYYSGRPKPVVSVTGIEASSCGQFAATYEHNSTDPDHDHNSNAYGITAEQSHAHVTKDYRDWLGNNLSGFITEDTLEKYRTITPSKLAGLLYTLYRVCRVNPEQTFASVVTAVLNDQPGLRAAETYVEGSDGE